ncbi:hypothetical protein ACHAWO_010638 [Cyclotella atomus]|uniref:Uncharacterized protein n=1 Tax=Cyclotella atomus TaxID=382360 RepID=A0ABD3PRU8_9STRA
MASDPCVGTSTLSQFCQQNDRENHISTHYKPGFAFDSAEYIKISSPDAIKGCQLYFLTQLIHERPGCTPAV